MADPIQWRKSPHPDPEVIAVLRQLLSAAQAGSVRSLAVVVVNPMLEIETATAGITDSVRRTLLSGGLLQAAVEIQKLVL